jgi:hypothetical protein
LFFFVDDVVLVGGGFDEVRALLSEFFGGK